MVSGEEAIRKTSRDNHHFLLATPVQNEVTKIAICSVLPIFDWRVNFFGNSHFRVKYSIEYLTDKEIYIYTYIHISDPKKYLVRYNRPQEVPMYSLQSWKKNGKWPTNTEQRVN